LSDPGWFSFALETSSATPLTSWRLGSGRTTRASRAPRGTTGHRARVRKRKPTSTALGIATASWASAATHNPIAREDPSRADRTFERDARMPLLPRAAIERARGVGVILQIARFHAHRPATLGSTSPYFEHGDRSELRPEL
jgi:hypothetical protein